MSLTIRWVTVWGAAVPVPTAHWGQLCTQGDRDLSTRDGPCLTSQPLQHVALICKSAYTPPVRTPSKNDKSTQRSSICCSSHIRQRVFGFADVPLLLLGCDAQQPFLLAGHHSPAGSEEAFAKPTHFPRSYAASINMDALTTHRPITPSIYSNPATAIMAPSMLLKIPSQLLSKLSVYDSRGRDSSL
jgi:hypothetical protein